MSKTAVTFIKLSAEDQNRFAKALIAPAPLTPAMERAIARYERAKTITEQALSLPADEREELLIALAVSLGRHPFEFLEEEDSALSDEYKQYLKDASDKGIASGPGKCATIEDIIGEARRRLSGERG